MDRLKHCEERLKYRKHLTAYMPDRAEINIYSTVDTLKCSLPWTKGCETNAS